jgi:hypothetical protein
MLQELTAFIRRMCEFTVTPEFENDYFTVIPASGDVNFPVVDNSVETENFCITANGVHNDVEVVMVPVMLHAREKMQCIKLYTGTKATRYFRQY